MDTLDCSCLCFRQGVALKAYILVQGATTVVDRLVHQLIGSPVKKPVEASYLHPLDPLTPDEVVLAAKVCKEAAERKGQAPLRFNAITLQVLWIYLADVPRSELNSCFSPLYY